MSTKRELELELEAARRPGGHDVRLVLPVLLLVGILAGGSIPKAAEQLGHGFSPLLMALVALPVMLLAWRVGFVLWPRDIYGTAPEVEWHYLVVFAGVGVAVALPCVGYLGIAPVFWPAVGFSAVFAMLLAAICAAAPGHAERLANREEEVHRDEVDALWRTIFDDSDLQALEIVERMDWESGAGFTLKCEPAPGAKRITFPHFRDALPALIANADYRMKRATGVRILNDCVIAEQGVGASELLLHVRTVDVFAGSVDYPARTQPGDIVDGLDDVGLAQDGERVNMTGATFHTKIVGRSGGGKSNLANVMIARTTDKANALIWICASTKLIPLVFPWLLPWLTGQTEWPVIDYIAGQSRGRILMMLRNAYLLADERNRRNTRKSKRTATPEEPAVIILLDEASDAVENDKSVIMCHDGIERNISSLLYAITRVGRSVNVSVKILTQVGLVSAMGSHGTELMRNLVERVCLATMSHHDGPATLPALPATVDATKLRNYSAYIQPSTEIPRAVPWKPYHLDGDEMIVPVALANTAWRPELEERSEVWNMHGYWDRWHPDALPELFAAVEDDEDELGTDWPYHPDEDAGDEDEVHVDAAKAAASVEAEERLAQAEHGGPAPDAVDDELEEIIREEQARPVDTEQAERRRYIAGEADDQSPGPTRRPAPRRGEEEIRDSSRTSPSGYDWQVDGEQTLDRLAEINRRLAAETDAMVAERAGEADDAAVASDPRPVPDLERIVGWLDTVVYALDEVRTGTLAVEVFGLPDDLKTRAELGRKLAGYGLRSKNVRRDIDAQQRKGYRVRELREAATRARFGGM